MFTIIGLCLCVVIWLYIKWYRLKNYWADRRVPHYSPYPVIGNMTFLQKENPVAFFRRAYYDFMSPYVGMWVFWRPALIINCPKIAKRVLVKDFEVFKNRFLSSGRSDPVGRLNLFTVNEPIWSSVRRQLTMAFTAAKLRSIEEIIIKKCDDLVERIKEEVKEGAVNDLRELFADFTTDVMGESAFGLSTETTKTGDSLLKNITRQYMNFNLFRGLSWSSIFFCPNLVDVCGFSLFPKSTTSLLRQIFRKIAEQRGGYNTNVTENKDLMDVLLNMKMEGSQVDALTSEDLLLAQASILLVGGFDTTAAVLTWATYEMAFQPLLQDKLFDELQETQQRINGKPFDSSTLSKLPYLNAIIKETLRKYPPMGWFDRISSSDYQISSRLTLPAGSIVYVNAAGMQMDPDLFPHPDTFDPERFMPENEKNIVPYSFMPFGEGPRGCIGKRFAYQILRYGLAHIFLKSKVSPSRGAPKPGCVRVDTNGMFYMPGEKLRVGFDLR